MSEVTLYAKDNLGRIRVWSCEIDDEIPGLRMLYGQLGGSLQEQIEVIAHGKSTRTWDEQAMLQLASKVSKKRDAGYVHKLEDAQNSARSNALNLKRPMLAQPYANARLIKAGAYWQYKYNGLRCLVKCTASGLVAYSRNGKLLENIQHILEPLANHMEEGDTFDGELYCHGESLQTILSWVKRKQVMTSRIKYHIYDKMSDDAYPLRYRALQEAIPADLDLPFGVVPTALLEPPTAPPAPIARLVSDTLREARSLGYEGIMIRHTTSGYEDGKRSKSLLKVKVWIDDEYEIIGISESKDGWAILECKLPTGGSFSVSAPGSIMEKKKVLTQKEKYIGRWVTVQYAELTKDGIPFHPVATMYRNKDAE